jgi:hypothetical protein
VRLGVERRADHALRELDGDLADLAPELLEDPVALGPDLLLRLRDGAAASRSARAWMSARSWSAVFLASSMMALDSCRAFASCCR